MRDVSFRDRYWSGLRAPSSRAAVDALIARGALVHVRITGGPMLLAARDDVNELCRPPPTPDKWPVRMLGRFDPLLLAHKDKTVWVRRIDYPRVWTTNGTIEATVLVHGRIAGTWSGTRVGEHGFLVCLKAFDVEAVSRAMAALHRQATGMAAFMGRSLTDLVLLDTAGSKL